MNISIFGTNVPLHLCDEYLLEIIPNHCLFEETQPKHHLPFHDLSPVGRLTKDLELYIFQKWQEAFLTLHVWDFCWIFNKTNWPPLPFMSPQKQYQSSKL